MNQLSILLTFVCALSAILLIINLVLAYHEAYREKKTPFECGFHSFLQNRTQFTISFFMFGLLFLIFDIEILVIYPFPTSSFAIGPYGYIAPIIFIIILSLGLIFEIGKKALTIYTKQENFPNVIRNIIPAFILFNLTSMINLKLNFHLYNKNNTVIKIIFIVLIFIFGLFIDAYFSVMIYCSSGPNSGENSWENYRDNSRDKSSDNSSDDSSDSSNDNSSINSETYNELHNIMSEEEQRSSQTESGSEDNIYNPDPIANHGQGENNGMYDQNDFSEGALNSLGNRHSDLSVGMQFTEDIEQVAYEREELREIHEDQRIHQILSNQEIQEAAEEADDNVRNTVRKHNDQHPDNPNVEPVIGGVVIDFNSYFTNINIAPTVTSQAQTEGQAETEGQAHTEDQAQTEGQSSVGNQVEQNLDENAYPSQYNKLQENTFTNVNQSENETEYVAANETEQASSTNVSENETTVSDENQKEHKTDNVFKRDRDEDSDMQNNNLEESSSKRTKNH